MFKTFELYFGLDKVCHRYKVFDGQITRQDILGLALRL